MLKRLSQISRTSAIQNSVVTKRQLATCLVTCLKGLISLGLLGVVLHQVDRHQFSAALQSISLPFLIFAFLYYAGCQWISCIRWQIILRACSTGVPTSVLMPSYFAGMFCNLVLPGAFGGDVYRAYRVSRHIQNAEVAFSSVLLERTVGIVAMMVLGILGLPILWRVTDRWDIVLLFLICTGIIVSAVLLMMSPGLLKRTQPLFRAIQQSSMLDRFKRIQRILRSFARDRKSVLCSIALSLLFNLAVIYYQYSIAQQLQIPISYLTLLVLTPILVVAALLPVSVGGLGWNESVRVYLFSRVGLTMEQAVLLSLALTGLGWLISLPGGLVVIADAVGNLERNAASDIQRKQGRNK